MVKRVFIYLDDDEFEKLVKLKGNKTWKEFLVEPILKKKEVK